MRFLREKGKAWQNIVQGVEKYIRWRKKLVNRYCNWTGVVILNVYKMGARGRAVGKTIGGTPK